MSKTRLGECYIILSAVLFGMMPLIANVAYRYGANAVTTAFLRFFLGGLLLLPLALKESGGKIAIPRRVHLEIVKVSVAYGITPILLYMSYEYVSTGLATTLHFIYPVVVILLLFFLYHERISKKQASVAALCILGVLLLEGGANHAGFLGVLLAAASGISYAVYILMLGKTDLGQLPTYTLSFWLSMYAALISGLIAICLGQFKLVFSLGFWGAEFALALTATVLALVLFQKGLFLCGEVKASLLSTFEPLTGVVIGIAVFHEVLTFQSTIGILLVLLSALLLVLEPGSKSVHSH